VTRRTVREHRVDGPQKCPEPPVCTSEKRTVHTIPADGPSHADTPATPGRQSGKHPPNKTPNETDRTEGTQELAKNSTNSQLMSFTWIVCACLADSSLGADRAARAQVAQSQHLLPFARSPESTMGFLPNHR
jgi:hypothetical protein